jgi:hypothetical protein
MNGRTSTAASLSPALGRQRGPTRRFGAAALVRAAILTTVAGIVAACGLVSPTPDPCGGFTPAECSEAIVAATRAVPLAVMTRKLVDAQVEQRGPDDAGLCKEWGVCTAVQMVAIVWLRYPSPTGGNESWPVAVVRVAPGRAMVAARPFPGSLDAGPAP